MFRSFTTCKRYWRLHGSAWVIQADSVDSMTHYNAQQQQRNKQKNKIQSSGKDSYYENRELLEIIYNKSNEMLVKFRAHFLRKIQY